MSAEEHRTKRQRLDSHSQPDYKSKDNSYDLSRTKIEKSSTTATQHSPDGQPPFQLDNHSIGVNNKELDEEKKKLDEKVKQLDEK